MNDVTIDTAAAGVYVAAPTGDLDAFTAPHLKNELVQLIEGRSARVVIVDLTGVTFLDSTALGVLIGALKRIRDRDGELRIVKPSPIVNRIFEITSLDRVLPLFETRDQALAA